MVGLVQRLTRPGLQPWKILPSTLHNDSNACAKVEEDEYVANKERLVQETDSTMMYKAYTGYASHASIRYW